MTKTKTTVKKTKIRPSFFEEILYSINNCQDLNEVLAVKFVRLTGRLFGAELITELESDVIEELQNVFKKTLSQTQVMKSFHAGRQLPVEKDHLKYQYGLRGIVQELNRHVLKDGQHFRVGNDFYENVIRPSVYSTIEPVFYIRKATIIKMEYGIEYLRSIRKYDGFCNEPDYINYQSEVSKHKNLFQPFQHIAKEGDFSNIQKMVKHTFGNQIEMGYDYLQLLYKKPKQALPVLCLVSREQGTGKTTFINWLSVLFKGNTIILGTGDIEGSFNAHYIDKHVICVDESDLHKWTTTSKFKKMVTQKWDVRKQKFVTDVEIPFYGKFILLSNDETTFINIKNEDNRYWIRKLESISEFDRDFEARIMDEIPSFIYFMQNRKLKTDSRQGRLWFSADQIDNEFLSQAKTDNKTILYMELLPRLQSWFLDYMNSYIEEIEVTPILIKIHLLSSFTKKEYDVKQIARCLREEFGLTSSKKTKRFLNPFYEAGASYLGNKEGEVGFPFTIRKTDVIENFEELKND